MKNKEFFDFTFYPLLEKYRTEFFEYLMYKYMNFKVD